jgi:hypothetical protein
MLQQFNVPLKFVNFSLVYAKFYRIRASNHRASFLYKRSLLKLNMK